MLINVVYCPAPASDIERQSLKLFAVLSISTEDKCFSFEAVHKNTKSETQHVADLCHILTLNSYLFEFSLKQTSHPSSKHIRELLCNRVMVAEDGNMKLPFIPFWKSNLFLSVSSVVPQS